MFLPKLGIGGRKEKEPPITITDWLHPRTMVASILFISIHMEFCAFNLNLKLRDYVM
jgi:hypothetical protein